MNPSAVRARILLGGVCAMGVASVVLAWAEPSATPLPPVLEHDVIHGATNWDLANLRRVASDAFVLGPPAPGAPHYGPTLALDGLEDARWKSVERVGAWTVGVPDEIQTPRRKLPLRDARVEAVRGETVRECKRIGAKFQCGDKPWFYVGPTRETIGGDSSECIWAHPLPGEIIRITYPSTSGPLRIRFGIRDASVGGGAPVTIRASRGGSPLVHTHSDRKGWSALNVPDGAGALTLEISASDIARRHFCYEAGSP